MNNFTEQVKKLFNKLPEKDRKKYTIIVKQKYGNKEVEITSDIKPKYKIYDMDKKFIKMEGVYLSEDEFKNKARDHGFMLHMRVEDKKVLQGRGRLSDAGKIKLVWQ